MHSIQMVGKFIAIKTVGVKSNGKTKQHKACWKTVENAWNQLPGLDTTFDKFFQCWNLLALAKNKNFSVKKIYEPKSTNMCDENCRAHWKLNIFNANDNWK